MLRSCNGTEHKLFIGHYCTLCTIPQVQLLVSAKDIENYNKIRKNLDKLKFLVEESELWVQKLAQEEKEAEPGKRVKEKVQRVAIYYNVRRLHPKNVTDLYVHVHIYAVHVHNIMPLHRQGFQKGHTSRFFQKEKAHNFYNYNKLYIGLTY